MHFLMTSFANLSQALVETVGHHRGASEALEAVLRALPPDAWRADEGEPCVLEALLDGTPTNLSSSAGEAAQAWADLMEWAFTERAAPSRALCVRLLRKAMDVPVDGRTMLDRVWTLTAPHLAPEDRLPLLNEALQSSWWVQDVVRNLLAMPGPTDLSDQVVANSPFMYVRNQSLLAEVMDAGFDPAQRLKDRTYGLWTVQNRQSNTFDGRAAFNAMVRLMHQRIGQGTRAPLEQLNLVLSAAQASEDLKSWLKALGPTAWHVRDEHGNTLLHQVMVQKPAWGLAVFEQITPQKPPLDLWAVLNQRGEHALLHGFLQRVDTNVWWTQFLSSEHGEAIAQTLPVLPDPRGAWRTLMKAAYRQRKPLPDLTAPSTWDLVRRMGGMDEATTRMELLRNPHWQEAFERLVIQVRLESDESPTRAWSGVTTWTKGVEPNHPWVLGFLLLDVATRLPMEAALASPSAPAHLRKTFDQSRAEAFDLVDRGASWAWAQRMVAQRGITVKHATLWAEVGQRWEARQLRTALPHAPDPSARVRVRL